MNKVYRVLDKDVSDYAIDLDNQILYYFVAHEGLYEMDMRTRNSKLIYEPEEYTKICYISYDGQYICLDNEWYVYYLGPYNEALHKVTVLNCNGDKLNQFDVGIDTVLMGDEQKLFLFSGATFSHAIGISGEGEYAVFGPAYINKSEVGSVNEFSYSVWP